MDKVTEKFKWRKWDYFWIIGILLGIIVLVCTLRLNDNDNVVNIISLISSSVSIALAIIAIWWGQVNNNSSNNLYEKMNEKLEAVQVGTSSINNTLISLESGLKNGLYNAIDTDKDMSESSKTKLKETVDKIVDENLQNTESMSASAEKSYVFEREVYKCLRRDLLNVETIWFPGSRYQRYDLAIENQDQFIAISVKKHIGLPDYRRMIESLPEIRTIENTKEKFAVTISIGDSNIGLVAGDSKSIKPHRMLSTNNLELLNLKEIIYEMINES